MKQQEVVLFTSNRTKLREAEEVFGAADIKVVAVQYDFVEVQSLSQEVVLRHKLAQVAHREQRPILVDDSGFYLDAYKLFPGTLTKLVYETIGYAGVLRLLPEGSSRRALFKSVAGMHFRDRVWLFEGLTTGHVSLEPRGIVDDTMLFEPLFLPEGSHSTLAELSFSRRMEYAYRVKAFKQAAKSMAEGL